MCVDEDSRVRRQQRGRALAQVMAAQGSSAAASAPVALGNGTLLHTTVWVSYLASYEHQGTASLTCVNGCT